MALAQGYHAHIEKTTSLSHDHLGIVSTALRDGPSYFQCSHALPRGALAVDSLLECLASATLASCILMDWAAPLRASVEARAGLEG